MNNWQSRDSKLHKRQVSGGFSKPFKEKTDKAKQEVQKKIRQAQKDKLTSYTEDENEPYE